MKHDSNLQREIMEQPEVLQRLLKMERPAIERVAAAFKERTPRFMVIAARGSSDNAARYGQYLFGAANGLPVALATPPRQSWMGQQSLLYPNRVSHRTF